MTIAAVYARYSSDRQNERSVEDQIRQCSERIGREGWSAGPVFADYAISGATRDRPGLNSLLEGAAGFDILVTESLDRLSRDQEDIAAIFKRLRFAGATIVTLSDGEVSEIHIGLRGTMAAMFLADLGEKTRRGQIGNIMHGQLAGGRSYGYRPAPRINARGNVERGHVDIDAEEAAIVRRIFDEFVGGRSPRTIAIGLNADGIPAPRGGSAWRASTINGSTKRRNGILHNSLYSGRILFNRQRFEKDPVTRKRIARLNPTDQWIEQSAEQLRIVDDSTWQAVRAYFDQSSAARPEQYRRPKRLLSGLVECGICQGPVTVVGAERWGCARHRDTGQCTNNRTISTSRLETRVIDALKRSMLTPEKTAIFIEEWAFETARWQRERATEVARWERQLDRVDGRIARLIDAIADGLGDYDAMKRRLGECRAEHDGLVASLAERQAMADIVIHPAVAADYAAGIATLQDRLSNDTVSADEFRRLLRPHIGKVVMLPADSGRGAALELHGVLAEILRFGAAGPEGQSLDCMPTVVAGAGFEPATFRL